MNYTLNLTQPGFLEQCQISQAAVMEQTEKIPKVGYYILILGLLCLMFYFIVQPRLRPEVQEALWGSMGYLGMCLVFLASWVLFFSVFQISEESLARASKIGGWLLIPLFLIVAWLVYWWVHKAHGVRFGK